MSFVEFEPDAVVQDALEYLPLRHPGPDSWDSNRFLARMNKDDPLIQRTVLVHAPQ
jgi:hypothetical protein